MNRREFIKRTGLTAAGTFAAPALAKQETLTWDKLRDLHDLILLENVEAYLDQEGLYSEARNPAYEDVPFEMLVWDKDGVRTLDEAGAVEEGIITSREDHKRLTEMDLPDGWEWVEDTNPVRFRLDGYGKLTRFDP